MLKNVTDLTAPDYSKGLNTIANILAISKNQTPNIMNIKVNFDGSVEKRAGSVTNNSVIIAQSGGAGWAVDAGASLNTSLIAFWDMNETAGNRKDAYGGHTLLDNNSVPAGSGIRNQAASFVIANSQYLLHANSSTLATGNITFSLSTWFRMNTLGMGLAQTIISKRDGIQAYGVNSNTVLMLHMNGANLATAFTDSSESNHSVTAAGTAQLSTTQVKFGTASGQFTNNGDVLTIPSHANFDFGTGDFTIDGWWWATTGGVTYRSLYDRGGTAFYILPRVDAGNLGLQVSIEGNLKIDSNVQPKWLGDQWQHWALVRSSAVLRFFHSGSSVLGDIASTENISDTSPLVIGSSVVGSIRQLAGYLDEYRITKGVALWTTSANFTVPTRAFYSAVTGSNFEYQLYVGTNDRVIFEVSSSGTVADGTITANSFGAITTGTWYHAIAYHHAASDLLAVGVNLSMTSAAYTSGVKEGSAPFVIGAVSNGAEAFLNGLVDETGFWKKALSTTERADLYNGGSANTLASAFPTTPWASFDFGASGTRWMTCSAGTGIYASSDLGRSWTTIGTSQSATYQYHDRSRNVLIVTSDLYDPPVFWAGSGGSYVVRVNSNAPLAKYSINFKGFAILMNTNARRRSFTFQDEATQLTGTWANSFDLPSSADDEITAAFILRRYLYVSTRYKLFRLSWVGGNPDWQYDQVRNFGFVPRTPKVLSIGQIGEVAIGESWDRRIRIFDGGDDKIISSDIEEDNKMCDFAMNKVSYAGSGLVTHFGEVDPQTYVYHLAVGIGQNSTNITHHINFDARTMSFYPYSNMLFTTMTVAESGGTRYLMAFDGSGYCHLMDSGNLDSGKTAVNEVFDSPFIFDKAPSQVSKAHKLDLFLSATSSGNLYFYDRTDFSPTFKLKHTLVLDDTARVLIKKPVDVPETYGVYQFRLSSSSGTADPWRLVRNDNFLAGLGVGGQ